MRKALSLYRRDGIFVVIGHLKNRVFSSFIKRRYSYNFPLIVDSSTVWLTGNYASVGKNLRLGKRCRVEVISEHNGIVYHPRLIIGNNVSINDDVHIGCVDKVTIGDDVLLAGKIYISDHNHGNYKGQEQSSPDEPPSSRPLSYSPVLIGNRVWIGEMVSILPGVTVGDGCIIGANSVVSRDIPPQTIAVGAPAKPIKKFDTATGLWIPYTS